MTQAQIVKVRRLRVSTCLAKSLTSPSQIANQLNQPVPEGKVQPENVTPKQISNDLAFMKKNSIKWLSGHTLDGYVFETQNTIEQLRDLELALQSRRSPTMSLDDLIRLTHELKEVINMRWVMMGDGPTLMHNKYLATQTK
jgi:hypothetical protein